MCLGCCWPFADVWLEDRPKEKKKEEEKKEWVFVPEGAVFYPVSSVNHTVLDLLSSSRYDNLTLLKSTSSVNHLRPRNPFIPTLRYTNLSCVTSF